MPKIVSDYTIDVSDAFRKLQQYIYFDNSDILLRAQLVEYIDKGIEKKLNNLAAKLQAKDYPYFDKLIDNIGLRPFPKSVELGSKGINPMPKNFVTNTFFHEECEIKRLAIFCDVPIELHIIAVLWIKAYGYRIETKLDESCYANRLLSQEPEKALGRSLFKRYISQYNKWWSDGINAAKAVLDKKEDVTIVNFDIKDYYHSVQLDFKKLESDIFSKSPRLSHSFLHILLKRIHFKYTEKLSQIEHPAYDSNSIGKVALPIGLLSSTLLANWFLIPFDRKVKKNINPVYYGRYVDDIQIVIKNKLLRRLDQVQKKEMVTQLNKHQIQVQSNSTILNPVNYFILRYLKSIATPLRKFVKDDGEGLETEQLHYQVNHDHLRNLKLQENKIYIYQFDAKLSPGLISKFIEEQKERSSEFRFLSDQEDESFDDSEEFIFDNTLSSDEINGPKFKKGDDNKYKFSVYLAKLIQRKIERGAEYKREEVENVYKYFKGIFVLKNYSLWEKLFTLFLVSKRRDLFIDLYKEIKNTINKAKIKQETNIDSSDVYEILYDHLKRSIEMSLGLDPNFLEKKIEIITENPNPLFFRKAAFLRKQYISYPFILLFDSIREGAISLLNNDLIWQISQANLKVVPENLKYNPYRIKLYDAVFCVFWKTLHLKIKATTTNLKREKVNDFDSTDILNESFELFCDVNVPHLAKASRMELKLEYFQEAEINGYLTGNDSIKQTKLTEFYIKNGGKPKESYRVALVNKYVNIENSLSSLQGQPVINSERVENYFRILDQIKLVDKLDLFVLPEVALPHRFLYRYVQFSAKNSKGFISGIEHIKSKNLGFNFVITCLPTTIDGDQDAVPIIRLKNHYAPEEEEVIRNHFMVVPKPDPYRYDLFEWRGLYFTTYYCYELADIYHRTLFYSMVDLICAPVWNADTHYYNNVVESATRDMHCYILQVNTSQYGDTRVTRPTDHVRKDKAKIKGGTVDGYVSTLLVCDLEVKKLRDFQKIDYPLQKQLNEKKKHFKPTPPDFPVSNVNFRENNKRFPNINDLDFI